MLEWTQDLSVNIEKIDNQHKELFKRTNNLLKACQKGKGKEEVLNTLNFLDYYINFHFRDEERFMRFINYPKIEEHKEMHREFEKTFENLKEEFQEGKEFLVLTVKLNSHLVKWLINHISGEDKEIGKFFKERNGI